MMEEDPLLVSRRRPFSSRVNLRRAESAEEVVEFEESYQNIEAGNNNNNNNREPSELEKNINEEATRKPVEKFIQQVSIMAHSGRYARTLNRKNLTELLDGYVHLQYTSKKKEFLWKKLPQQDKIIKNIVQKQQEERAFSVEEDPKVNVKIFDSLLREMRTSKGEENLYNLLRHHMLVRPARKKQEDSGDNNNKSINPTKLKRSSSRESSNSNNSIGSTNSNQMSLAKVREDYDKKKAIGNLFQKGLFNSSLETILIATKVILKEYKDHGDSEHYASETGLLLSLLLNIWVPNQDRLIYDVAKHWVKSSILEWKCRTTGRVIWKRAGGAKLEVDDSTSGYSVFSGKSYKVSTNSIVNDNLKSPNNESQDEIILRYDNKQICKTCR